MTKEEKSALRDLRAMEGVTILPADKGNIRSDLQFSAFSEVAKQEFALVPQQYQKETDQRITAITSDLSEAGTTRLSARLREVQLAGLHDNETGMHTRMEGEAAKQSLQTIDGLMAG